MRGIVITATGWIRQVDITAEQIAATVGTCSPTTLDAWHNIGLWCTPAELNAGTEPNMAATTVLLCCSDHSSDTVPILTGNVLLLGTDAHRQSIGLNDAQMAEVSAAMLTSLAA